MSRQRPADVVARMRTTTSRIAVALHPVRARIIAQLPKPVRAFARDTSRRARQVMGAGRVDEWGHSREILAIDDWSTPLVGPAGVGPAFLPDDESGSSGSSTAPEGGPANTEQAPVAVDGAPELRCLLVCSVFDVGGVGEVVAFLATRLREHGILTAILNTVPNPAPAGVPTGRLAQRTMAAGIEVIEVDATTGPPWLDAWKPDVVYAHGSPDWVLEHTSQAAIPYVDVLHGMHSLFGGDWAAEAVRAKNITRVVAVSELVRRQYLAGNPSYPAADIVAIPNAVEDRRFVPVERATARAALGLSDEYVFVCLARHCLQKNTYGLVTVFAEFARTNPQAHLVIAGRIDDDRYFRHLRKMVEGLPSRDRIHLRDHLSEPRLLLAAADGFVLDSFFEGWSLASMEALFAGVPVVLSDVGGAQEQVGDDPRRGFVVANPLGDPVAVEWDTIVPIRYSQQVNKAAFVEAMQVLVDDRDAYLAGRDALARESAERFDADACIKQHADVLFDAARSSIRQ